MYQGQPDGDFVRLGEYPSTTVYPQRVVSGDLDGDGRDEFVTWSDHVRTWSLEADASLTTRIVAAESAYAVTLADLDGDGILDLIRTSQESRLARIDRGRGDTTFEPLTSITGDITLGVPHVVDLDLDGDLDLVLPLGEGMATRDWFTVALNRGDGTFDLDETRHVTPQVPRGMALGDVDGDGFPDVVAGTFDGIATYRGDGRGRFWHGDQVHEAGNIMATRILDVFSRGRPEIVVVGHDITVLPVNEDRSFADPVRSGVGPYERAVFGDMNGDGHLDVIALLHPFREAPYRHDVLLGDGCGRFTVVSAVETALPHGHVALVDLTGDGHLDLLMSRRLSGEGSPNVRLVQGHGDGTFSGGWEKVVSTDGPFQVVELNGDGWPDVVFSSSNSVLVGLGTQDGEIELRSSHTTSGGSWGDGLAAEDISGDGVVDLVIGTQYTVDVLNGLEGGDFGPPVAVPVGDQVTDLELFDVDRDGDLDVLAMAHTSTHVLLNQGDGTLELESLAYGTGPDAGGIDVGDLDGDGVPDLLSSIWDHAQVMWGVGDPTPPVVPGTPDRPWTVSLAPSPALGATRIGLDLGRAARVGVSVHDVSGRRIVELASTRTLDPGPHAWSWDGTTSAGRRAGAGVYVVRVEIDGVEESRRLVLLD